MRLTVSDSPRHVAKLSTREWIHLRVISGNVLLARENQSLVAGDGLPVGVSDGLVSLNWQAGDLWIQSPSGSGSAVLEVVLP